MLTSVLCGYGQTVPAGLTVETMIATGLSQPIMIAFYGLDDYFVLEKATGKVRIVENGSLLAASALDLPVANNSERGLLGIALDPNFAANNYVYLYYSRSSTTSDGSSWLDNRVERYTWNPGSKTLTDATLLINFLPDAMGNGPNHDGGVIIFGPDGKLYGVTGDLNRNGKEQNYATAAVAQVGGVFRLNADGSIPADNIFNADGVDPAFKRLYASGIRNSFGMVFDSKSGQLWETENGPSNYDEINLILPGFNGGWEDVMGPMSRTGVTLGDLYFVTPDAFYSEPEYSWLATIAPTGIAFLHSAKFDAATLRDKMVVGDNNLGFLYLFTPNANRDGLVLSGGNADLVADSSAERDAYKWGSGFGVITDVKMGPDGYLWVTSLTNGDVYRIRPTAVPNTISGKVTLDTFTALPTGVSLKLELTTGPTLVETITTKIGAYGEYYVSPASVGTYDIVAKAGHWLAEKTVGVTIGTDTKVDWNMATNGDIVEDNKIDIFDLNRMFSDFATPNADVTGDGFTDIFDLNTALIKFGMVGQS